MLSFYRIHSVCCNLGVQTNDDGVLFRKFVLCLLRTLSKFVPVRKIVAQIEAYWRLVSEIGMKFERLLFSEFRKLFSEFRNIEVTT